MRINEHMFQGFFGIKTKKDSAKYYSERVEKLKGLDENLDSAINEFQKILANHDTKLKLYLEFMHKYDKDSFQNLKNEINKLEGLFDPDALAKDSERRYVIKIEDTLKNMLSNEENAELTQMENDTMYDLKELHRLLETVKPLWEAQIEFIRQNDDIILSDKNNIKILSDILREEGDVLRMEEVLLKKIDLKTGAILRKTTLRLRDLEDTQDMNMRYREIKHIR